MHKADRFFEGSTVIFEKRSSHLDPLHFFKIYLRSRDSRFPHLPQPWLCSTGKVPNRSLFILLRNINVQRSVDRKSTRLNSSHTVISYAVFCLKKKKKH